MAQCQCKIREPLDRTFGVPSQQGGEFVKRSDFGLEVRRLCGTGGEIARDHQIVWLNCRKRDDAHGLAPLTVTGCSSWRRFGTAKRSVAFPVAQTTEKCVVADLSGPRRDWFMLLGKAPRPLPAQMLSDGCQEPEIEGRARSWRRSPEWARINRPVRQSHRSDPPAQT